METLPLPLPGMSHAVRLSVRLFGRHWAVLALALAAMLAHAGPVVRFAAQEQPPYIGQDMSG